MQKDWGYLKVLAVTLVICTSWAAKSKANVNKDLEHNTDTALTVDKPVKTVLEDSVKSVNIAKIGESDTAYFDEARYKEKSFYASVYLEDFKARPYNDGWGNITIGAGYTYDANGRKVTRRTPAFRTIDQVKKNFDYFFKSFNKELEKRIHLEKATEDQRVALFLMYYQRGPVAFSKIQDKLNAYLDNPCAETECVLPGYVKELSPEEIELAKKKKVNGKTDRRAFEYRLFTGKIKLSLGEIGSEKEENVFYVKEAKLGGAYRSWYIRDNEEFCDKMNNINGKRQNPSDTIMTELNRSMLRKYLPRKKRSFTARSRLARSR